MNPIQGLHHITAIASDPQSNIDFYDRVLGQRLIKTTVNFDDPGTYHLYYGDEIGTPGTVLTFFPWPRMARGRRGAGETVAVAYRIPPDAIGFWADRLETLGVEVQDSEERFGEQVLLLEDPDGMRLELVATESADGIRPWTGGPVDQEFALRGFHGVTLLLSSYESTEALLVDQMGYTPAGREGNRRRYRGASDMAAYVDVLADSSEAPARLGAGSVHHIAFRTVDDEEQLAYQGKLRAAGQEVTGVRDRQYFHSIYFREPGGVLFEIATRGPGFTLDEEVDALGSSLKLPPWYESRRDDIEKRLPRITRPGAVRTPTS